ncbi:tlde1 domain-containing protein [uncultured Roseibium sp.]|uniref:tlde1 domain-containing protein n=1 Tax=uncultured Roseibium sp. TaxID=1936171 RepID=UPI0026367EB2|nr:tlde1 domain-containing protein [uncultured Roseibium sp.]
MANPKKQRTFYALLAGSTLLIAGFAASAVFLGPALTPENLSPLAAKSETLTLAHVTTELPASAGLPVSVAAAVETAKFAKSPAAMSVQAEAAEAALRQQAEDALAEARRTAKNALAAKLAKLKLTRTLLAAKARRTPAADKPAPVQRAFAEAPAAALSPVLPKSLAAKPAETSPETASEVEVASLDPQASRSLVETAGPIKPGAIPTRLPGVKPEIVRSTKPSVSKPVATKPRREKPSETTPVLAYATPGNPEEDENGVFSGLGKLFGGGKGGLPGANSKVAVYDISAATVHMPDGTKLEAHSGIGAKMDNPKYAYVKNYGPTPPNIYKLRMRERLFHGVEAIRMLPHDRAAMKGRDGMLTHTRLLRRSIGSHGCVAFKDYNKFLNAFKAGKVKTLIVVPSMEKLPTYMAKLQRSTGA